MNTDASSSKEKASYKAHKKDFIWQILVPILVILLLVIAASVIVTLRPAGDASLWADISTIWLLIPLLFFAFINIIILAAIIYGMSKLLNITPIYTQKLYALIILAGEKIESIVDDTVKPIFLVEGFSASLKSIKNIFRQK